MLNILRKNAQSLVIQALVVVIAIVFVFWGVGTKLRNSSNAMAVVNGEQIGYQEFQQSYERAVENYKQQFGGQLPQGMLESMGLKDQILNQLIQSELLRQGATKLGIQVSKEAVQEKIQGMGVFNKNGHFDLDSYKAILERNHLTPTAFEQGIMKELLISRMIEAVGSFATVPKDEIENWLDYANQEIKIGFAAFKSEDFVSKVKVTEPELNSWYQEHKKEYLTPPQYKIQYLFFNYSDDLPQVTVTNEAVSKYYQDNINTYHKPEQRRARHILFRLTKEDGQEARDAKNKQAEAVLARLRGGEDFSKLAREFSEDQSKDNGGDLGFFNRGQMVKPFDEAVFALKKGELSGIVETPFGFHIIRLEESTPEKIQSQDEARASIVKQLEQQEGKGLTFKKASTAYEEIMKAGSLDKYSAGSGVRVRGTDFFSKDNPPDDKTVRDETFLQSVFSLKKGELSSIVETSTGYAIVFVTDVKEPLEPDLDTVRERVIADYKKAHSVDLAKAAAEAALKEAREKGAWPAGTAKHESGYIKRTGSSGIVPAQIRQDAFALAGKNSFPDKILTEGTTFSIYQILDVRQGAQAPDEIMRGNIEKQLLTSKENQLMVDWLNQFKQQAKIWKNNEMLN